MILNKGFGLISSSAIGGGSSGGTVISAADFTGSTYSNALLSGKTPMTDFNVFNLGSGTLKTVNVDYTFSGTTLTMPADDYLIEIY